LLLWTKRAFLIFHRYEEIDIDPHQQQKITEWLQMWEAPAHTETALPERVLDINSNLIEHPPPETIPKTTHIEQMEITNWLKSWGDRHCAETVDSTSVQSTVDLST
jgi:hypothetical protein